MQSLLTDVFTILFVPRFRYSGGIAQLRARITLIFTVLLSSAGLIAIIGVAVGAAQVQTIETIIALITVGVLLNIVLIALIHSGQAFLACLAQFAFMNVFALTLFGTYGIDYGSLLPAAVIILYAGVLGTAWSPALMTVIYGGVTIIAHLLQVRGIIVSPTVTVHADQHTIRLVSSVGLLSVMGILSTLFAYELRRGFSAGGRTLTQLRAIAEVAKNTAEATTLGDLLQRTVDYIRDRFGFFHVQVFLLDNERRYANLAASTGDLGEQLMQRGYRLAMGSQSMVGRALISGEPIITGSYEDDSLGRSNELLREMRSELVLPLIVGEAVIGALDIQSARANAFSNDEVNTLKVLATQVALIVYNGKQLEEARLQLNETRRLLLETEVSLRDTQRLNQRLTGEAWEGYLKLRNAAIIGYTLSDTRLTRDTSWTPGLEQAAGKRRPVLTPLTTESGQQRQLIAVPIELRGRTIGAIEVEMDGTIRQAEMLDVLQSVSQRLALSVDNARLFEQAQELAQRELEVNAISSRLQGIGDIDELAKITLQELGRALGAAHAVIRLGAPGAIANGSTEALPIPPSTSTEGEI